MKVKSLMLAAVIVPLLSAVVGAAFSATTAEAQRSMVLAQAETSPQSPESQAPRHGMMGGGGTMGGPGMMGGPGGMMEMPMMQMMMSDPKTRGQMMEIHGRMMKEMGELMEKRGQEIEQSK
jgi:hypothetical protein